MAAGVGLSARLAVARLALVEGRPELVLAVLRLDLAELLPESLEDLLLELEDAHLLHLQLGMKKIALDEGDADLVANAVPAEEHARGLGRRIVGKASDQAAELRDRLVELLRGDEGLSLPDLLRRLGRRLRPDRRRRSRRRRRRGRTKSDRRLGSAPLSCFCSFYEIGGRNTTTLMH